MLLKYSQLEEVERIDDIKHPLIREALRLLRWDESSAGNHQHGRHPGRDRARVVRKLHHGAAQGAARPDEEPSPSGELAEQACKIEMDILKEPVGKQDQYIAAFGGITCFRFLPNGQVEAWPLKISQRTIYDLEDHLLLFFTGYTRSAGEILKEQDTKSKKNDSSMIANLHFVKQLGRDIKDALEPRRPAAGSAN